MKISSYIFLSFLFILLLFSLTTFINYRLSEAVNEDAEYFSKSANILRNSTRFQRNILNMMSGLRGYLLTGERSFIESYDNADKDNEAILQELTGLIDDSTQLNLLNDIKNLNHKWTEEYTDPLRTAKMLANVNDSNLHQFNKFYREKYLNGDERVIQEKLQNKFKEFSNSEYNLREERKSRLSAFIKQTGNISFFLTLISFVTGFVVVAFVIKKISKRISKMTGMANAIATGNYDVNIQDTGHDELSSLGHSLNRMAYELSKNISLLKKSNEELDQFAHIVSHDLKGPLRGIDHIVTWIEEDHKRELSPKVAEYVEIIKRRVTRAENLIAGLLSYARTGKEKTDKEPVDVNVLVSEVLDNISTNDMQITVKKLPTIQTEKILLYQVFYNLITNAIKYNDKDNGEIKIYHKAHDDGFEFFVEDNGIGIAEHYHKRIFVIFQTLNDTGSYESTGVGLAIVKKILDSKKKRISVHSEPGKGSVFSFTWPKN
jgi:signal transduction histidine kinase